MTPAEMAKVEAHLKALLGRDSREIIAEAMTIARRCYTGPEDGLLIGLSDNRRGCLICRMADRGDIKAMSLLLKMPKLRITVATSEQLSEIAAGRVVTREEREKDAVNERFRRDVRAALGDLISPEEICLLIEKLGAAAMNANNEDDVLEALGKEVRSRGFPDARIGDIVIFVVEAWNRLHMEVRRARGRR
jgi:hypothetical protein